MIWGSRPRAGDRRWRAGVVAAATAALLGSACSSGDVESAIEAPLPDYVGPCADQYTDGDLINYDDGTFSNACRDDAGELVVPVPSRLDCTDGPDLVYNDFAWGYEGDVMTLFPPDDEERRPDQELILACLNRDETEGDEGDEGESGEGTGDGGEAAADGDAGGGAGEADEPVAE